MTGMIRLSGVSLSCCLNHVTEGTHEAAKAAHQPKRKSTSAKECSVKHGFIPHTCPTDGEPNAPPQKFDAPYLIGIRVNNNKFEIFQNYLDLRWHWGIQ